MAERGRDLVISDPNVVIEGAETSAPNLVAELKEMGGKVEVVDIPDVNAEGAVQKLVDRAMDVFGGFDSAFMFRYSVREGTAAARLDDDVPEQVWALVDKSLVELRLRNRFGVQVVAIRHGGETSANIEMAIQEAVVLAMADIDRKSVV